MISPVSVQKCSVSLFAHTKKVDKSVIRLSTKFLLLVYLPLCYHISLFADMVSKGANIKLAMLDSTCSFDISLLHT